MSSLLPSCFERRIERARQRREDIDSIPLIRQDNKEIKALLEVQNYKIDKIIHHVFPEGIYVMGDVVNREMLSNCQHLPREMLAIYHLWLQLFIIMVSIIIIYIIS